MERDRPGETWRIRAGEERSRKIGGPEWRTETGDITGDPGRSTRLEGKEDETVGFPMEFEGHVEVGEEEGFPVGVEAEGLVEVGEEEVPVEDEEGFPVEDADVAEDLKTEADIRREEKIGDVETVASKTIQTGWNVTSVGTPSQMSLNLHRPTPWTTRGTRSSK